MLYSGYENVVGRCDERLLTCPPKQSVRLQLPAWATWIWPEFWSSLQMLEYVLPSSPHTSSGNVRLLKWNHCGHTQFHVLWQPCQTIVRDRGIFTRGSSTCFWFRIPWQIYNGQRVFRLWEFNMGQNPLRKDDPVIKKKKTFWVCLWGPELTFCKMRVNPFKKKCTALKMCNERPGQKGGESRPPGPPVHY